MVDVTVVVPTHNRRALLAQTVRSVCAQRGVDWEMVVVDDGSTDGTAGAVSAPADPRIRVVRHEKPRGVAAARNAGIAASAGRWVALLDDDDLWAPDKLARQLRAARVAGRRWVYAGAVEIDVSGRLLGGLPPPSPEFLVGRLRKQNLMPAGSSNVLVEAGLLAEVGPIDMRLRHIADWDLWLRLAQEAKPAYDPSPLVAYRMHGRQATLDTAGMRQEAKLLADRHGIDPAVVHRWEGWSHLRSGSRLSAARSYASAAWGGDLLSVGRAAVALLSPNPTAGRRRGRNVATGADWAEQATAWLADLPAGRGAPVQ